MLVKNLTKNSCTFGIITAIPKEFAAVEAMLGQASDVAITDDPTIYTTSIIGSHGVVLALLPKMGLEPAAIISTHLLRSFPNVRDILMVGIAGGVPNPANVESHVRLGDIVVSADTGVIQFDIGKKERISHEDGASEERFIIRSSDPPPSARLQQAVRLMEARRLQGQHPWESYIERTTSLLDMNRPLDATDMLYDSYEPDRQISHPVDMERIRNQPRIHYGPIASSNMLLKDPLLRDYLRNKYGVRAVEMEGSGIAAATWSQHAGYLLIRGICDYCDSHKNDIWQGYAATAAAAFAIALLHLIPAKAEPSKAALLHPDNEKLLRQALVEYFTLTELDNLCGDIEVNMRADHIDVRCSLDIVGGDGHEQSARRLIDYLKRRGYLHYLVHAVCLVRPNVELIQELGD